MTCRSCGTEIADRAIVCYRCGTPTAMPAAAPRAAARRGSAWPWILGAAIVLAAAAAYWWLR